MTIPKSFYAECQKNSKVLVFYSDELECCLSINFLSKVGTREEILKSNDGIDLKEYRLKILDESLEATLDSRNRIRIPKISAKKVDIFPESDVLCVGIDFGFQIWEPNKYKSIMNVFDDYRVYDTLSTLELI